MRIHHQSEVTSQRFAQSRHNPDVFIHSVANVELNRPEALFLPAQGKIHLFFQPLNRKPRYICRDFRTMGTAQQLVHRQPHMLSCDIPQCAVYRSNGIHHKSRIVPPVTHQIVQLIPDHLNIQRIPSQQNRSKQFLNNLSADIRKHGSKRFSPPHDPRIRGDLDVQRLHVLGIRAPVLRPKVVIILAAQARAVSQIHMFFFDPYRENLNLFNQHFAPLHLRRTSTF